LPLSLLLCGWPIPLLLSGCAKPLEFSQAAANSGRFSVAEVKPHYQCAMSQEGTDRVRIYVANLASQGTGLIGLIQFEFMLEQPEGYTAFGAACVSHYSDPAVVLVDTRQFHIISGIGETVIGDYTAVPFLSADSKPTKGSMCVSDPANGERGYAGALLMHKASNIEVCVVIATLPHCDAAWQPRFLEDLNSEGCKGRHLLLIMDTNAACEKLGPLASRNVTMQHIGQIHSADWGMCLDPGILAEPTCCHDSNTGFPEARYWYDRTALCGGYGAVENFHVHEEYVCNTIQEHKFTTAMVRIDAAGAAARGPALISMIFMVLFGLLHHFALAN